MRNNQQFALAYVIEFLAASLLWLFLVWLVAR